MFGKHLWKSDILSKDAGLHQWNNGRKWVNNKNLFKRLKYPSPNALKIKYFGAISYNYWGLFGITKLSNL